MATMATNDRINENNLVRIITNDDSKSMGFWRVTKVGPPVTMWNHWRGTYVTHFVMLEVAGGLARMPRCTEDIDDLLLVDGDDITELEHNLTRVRAAMTSAPDNPMSVV